MFFTEIGLQTKRLSDLYQFYKEVLMLPVSDISDSRFTVHAGNTRLIFQQSNNTRQEPFYHFAFNIPSNKIDEASAWLENRTALLWIEDYESYIADFRNWNAKSVYFRDPAGNIAEFIARKDLNDLADEPFSSKQVRNVSEIGLVFPEQIFKQSIEELLKENQLSYFAKQPPLENFCAIGDDDGLFIVVPENRSWYPCKNKPAGLFPMQVTFLRQNDLKTIRIH